MFITSVYTLCNKRKTIKFGNKKSEKNRKYYRKCSNNFAADCRLGYKIIGTFLGFIIGVFINSIMPKDNNLTNIYLIKLHLV